MYLYLVHVIGIMRSSASPRVDSAGDNWAMQCHLHPVHAPVPPSACRPFSLADLNDYQTHFTVMNYREDSELKNILHDKFIPLFDQQYSDHPWREVEVRGHMQRTHEFSHTVCILRQNLLNALTHFYCLCWWVEIVVLRYVCVLCIMQVCTTVLLSLNCMGSHLVPHARNILRR